MVQKVNLHHLITPPTHEKENEEDLKTPIYGQEAIKERKSPNSAHIEWEFLTNWYFQAGEKN